MDESISSPSEPASGGDTSRYNCPMCVFAASSISLVLSHLRLVHSSDPHFCVTCGIGGCCTTTKSFSALYQHIRKKHKDSGIIQERHGRDISRSSECTVYPQVSHAEVGLEPQDGKLNKPSTSVSCVCGLV